MKKISVAINGLGRIGRLCLRTALSRGTINIVAVNDIGDINNLAYLLKYDSTHGRLNKEIAVDGQLLVVDGKRIKFFSEKDPAKLPWKDLNIDYVIESSGHFTHVEGARKHIEAGAKRVIISAPAKGDHVPTYVLGVNHTQFDPERDTIVSNASCTTNCLAPIAKVLLDNFGIEEALMTTVHAVTAWQPAVDASAGKDWRGGRAASQNIIPASTGAATAVGLCLPALKGKLTGMAFRVPIVDVSVVDLTVKLTKSTSYDEICKKMKEAAAGPYKGIIQYCDEEVVSSDFIGSTFSAIFDAKAGIALNDRFYKIIAWYDNETAYATRVLDLMEYMAQQNKG